MDVSKDRQNYIPNTHDQGSPGSIMTVESFTSNHVASAAMVITRTKKAGQSKLLPISFMGVTDRNVFHSHLMMSPIIRPGKIGNSAPKREWKSLEKPDSPHRHDLLAPGKPVPS